IGTLTLRGATVATGVGTLTLGGNVTNLASSVNSLISGNLNLGSVTRIIGVAQGTAVVDLDITANISGTGGITKTGLGALRLAGNNTYTVPTVSNGGELRVDSDTALGGVGSG